MRRTRAITAPVTRRWHKWADIAWTIIGLSLTALFSIALYFDLSGISPLR